MKIQSDLGNTAPAISSGSAASKPATTDQTSDVKSAANEASADSVSTSGLADRLEADPAREAQIERLRQAVRDGTYSVSASDISASIVDAHLTGITKRS
jgi:anti-sigma28 factor (negative regulator of flagellin synthesis)